VVVESEKVLSSVRSAWSRSSKLILVQAAVAVVLLWAIVLYSACRVRDDIIETRRAVMAQTVSVVQEQASQIFTLLRVTLQAADQWIVNHPKSDPSHDPKFIQLIEGFRKSSGGRVDIRMVTRENHLAYVPFRAEAAATDVSDREYVLAQKDPQRRGFFIAAPVFSRVTQKWGIPVSIPVSTSEGGIAILYGAIEVDHLFTSHSNGSDFSGATFAWIRNDAVLLARYPLEPKSMGVSMAQTADWVSHQSAEQSGVFLSERSPVDGQERLIAFSRLEEYPLTAFFSESLEEVLLPWKSQFMLMVAFGLLLTGAIGAMTRRLIRSIHVSETAVADLAKVNRELVVLSVTDKLTQIFNRVKLDSILRSEIGRATRHGTPLSVILIDFDYFKEINDAHGHATGDLVLVQTANILRQSVRTEDAVGRWGGEEFMIILPQTGLDQAAVVAEKIRKNVEDENFVQVGKQTASFGVTCFVVNDSESSILARADRALYAAKAKGRNRVVVDAELGTPATAP
jgi:diguanylate cyclase (GGDEF)-like protein